MRKEKEEPSKEGTHKSMLRGCSRQTGEFSKIFGGKKRTLSTREFLQRELPGQKIVRFSRDQGIVAGQVQDGPAEGTKD